MCENAGSENAESGGNEDDADGAGGADGADGAGGAGPTKGSLPCGGNVGVASLYHERQVLMRCGRHALNNLLGSGVVTDEELERHAASLATSRLDFSHRWPVLGNYDANVVLLALAHRGYEAQWWDRRSPNEALRDALRSDASVVGLLLNVRRPPGLLSRWLPIPIHARHWVALRPMAPPGRGAPWADLDSNLASPVLLLDEDARVTRALGDEESHVIIVRSAADPRTESATQSD